MPHEGRFVAWDQVLDGLPDPLLGIDPLPLSEMFDTVVRRYPDHAYLNYRNITLSYRASEQLVSALAFGLQDLGIEPGVRVGLCMFPHPAYAIAVNALWRIGAVGVGMNPLYAEPMLMRIAADSGARLIISTDLPGYVDKIERLAHLNAARLLLFEHGGGDLPLATARRPAATSCASGAIRARDLLEQTALPRPVTLNASRNLAMIQYTGGTTGEPKGVMLTHANLCASCVQQRSKFKSMRAGAEVTQVSTPFTHIGSLLAGLIYTTSIAGELVIADRFVAAEALASIAAAGVTYLPAAPTLLIALMRDPAARATDWSTLRYVLSAAAPTPPEIKNAFAAMTGADIRICYGSTEAGPGIAMQEEGDAFKGSAAASTGTAFPLTDISVRDPESPATEMPIGSIGEICVAGPQVMSGYWRKPEATTSAFVAGYLRTGDLGYVDALGRVYLVDRLKDVINVSGYKVYPALIESAVYDHPAICEAVAVGVPDSYRGETVVLFAVLKEGSTLILADLQRFLASKLSPMEIPKRLEIRPELPKTAVGKLSRALLRSQLQSAPL